MQARAVIVGAIACATISAAHAQDALVATTPGALSSTCAAAQTSIDGVLADLEGAMPAALPADARAAVGADSPSADAWNEFAAAALLMGDTRLAAWAGLHAAQLEWDAEHIGNAGTYLLHAERPEARDWLLCAAELGPRSAFTFEALAVAHERNGDAARAREALGQGRRFAPDDAMLEIEYALATTGAPPAPAPLPNETGERCLADLTRHAERVYAQVEAQQTLLDRLSGQPMRAQAFEGAWESLYQPMLASLRELLDQPLPAGMPATMQRNNVLAQCVIYYFQYTEILLGSVLRDDGTTITFWADATSMTPAGFVRDIVDRQTAVADAFVTSADRLPSTAVDQERYDADEEARRRYDSDRAACSAIRDGAAASACAEEASRRECAANVIDFEKWVERQAAIYNAAAQSFDRTALDLARWVERELERARTVAEYYASELDAGGAAFPGPDGRPMTALDLALELINARYATLVENNLSGPYGSLEQFVAEQAQWFENEKQAFEEDVALGREDLAARCVPVLFREELEALARQEWEAYRQDLWDRMTGNIEAEWDATGECEVSIASFSIGLDDKGVATVGAKWKKLGASVDSTRKVKASGSWEWRDVTLTSGATIREGQVVSAEIGVSGEANVVPGVVANGGITLVSDGSRDEPGIVFSGSLGFGVERGGVGVSCTPGRGSVKVYPRAFTGAALTYVMTTR